MAAEVLLAQIASEVAVCTRCPLHRTRTQAVPGEGPAAAEIMLIGEGPGFHEDRQGRPFVGSSGKFLTKLLAEAGLQRSDVWIGNVIKCRPPNNRDPQPAELQACSHFLERQIAVIDPKIIITLGRFSMGRYFPGARISHIHGKMQEVNGRFVIPMFHPAAALHNPRYRPLIMEDFARLPQQLEQARQALAARQQKAQPPEPADEGPEQLQLF